MSAVPLQFSHGYTPQHNPPVVMPRTPTNVASRRIRSYCRPYVGAWDLQGVRFDPLATQERAIVSVQNSDGSVLHVWHGISKIVE